MLNLLSVPKLRSRLIAVAASLFVVTTLSGFAAEKSPAEDEDVDSAAPRFISPDGRYGLLVTSDAEGDSGNDRVELIELATKRSLIVLSDPESPELSRDARLDWSGDSKRVAAYTATRVSGFTRIFSRDGETFVEVKLPKLPDLPDLERASAAFRKKHKFKFLKWITTDTLEFVRWLDSGDVELQAYNEAATEDGGGFRAQINLTLAIDTKNRATLKKAVREERHE
jgi:hypothetical protein